MGKYIGPKNKIARRFGAHLGLKSNPSKVARRIQQPPGVHGPKKRSGASSGYGKQLLEKQKAKFVYGVRERQFSNYVDKASKMEGDSGKNLLRLLEMRLDNVVYRMGFAKTRAQARQFVSHGLFNVNGRGMNVPSHFLKVGDVVSLKENKSKKKIFADIKDQLAGIELPSWLSLDVEHTSGKIINNPAETDFERIFDIKPIIEYYSIR